MARSDGNLGSAMDPSTVHGWQEVFEGCVLMLRRSGTSNKHLSVLHSCVVKA